MSTESSSSKEDISLHRDRSNSESSSCALMKRAPRYQLDNSLTNENEEIENADNDYPICESIDRFYKEFQNRNKNLYKYPNTNSSAQSKSENITEFCNNYNFNLNHSFCFSTPNVPKDIINIPEKISLHVSKVVVLLSELSALDLNGKKVQPKYIHSWKNISKIAPAEARRYITSFFNKKYMQILSNQPDSSNRNLSLANSKSKSTSFYNCGQKFLANNPNYDLSSARSPPKITWNSSSFNPCQSTCPMKVQFYWTDDKNSTMNFFQKPISLNSLPPISYPQTSTIRIFHYVGLGLPPPTEDSLFTVDMKDQKPSKTLISDLNLLPPMISIFDCDKAATLMNYFKEHKGGNAQSSENLFVALFATSKSEKLRIPSSMPQNLFSCILLSPMHAFSDVTKIQVEDREMFKLLLTIFTESICLDSLPTETFYSIFRREPVVSTLWQNFFLAQRLMHKYGLQCKSFPEMRDMSEHQLWYQFEYAMMSAATLSHLQSKTSTKNENGSQNEDSNDDYDPEYETNSSDTNFVNESKKLAVANYTSSVFSAGPITDLSKMYCISFDTLENPPTYVTAFVASLISVPSLHHQIMAQIARFMSKSPQNCVTMGKVLNYSILCQVILNGYDEIQFVNWCCVMSGFLLAAPSLVSFLSSSVMDSSRLMRTFFKVAESRAQNKVKNKNNSSNAVSENSIDAYLFESYTDAISVYILTILVSIRDSPNSLKVYSDNEMYVKFFQYFYNSSPIVREWIIIFFHASFVGCNPYTDLIGHIHVHGLALLLLYESRKFTRAASLAVLMSTMTPNFLNFDHTLMNCALKAAVDGSYIVRHTFLLCVAYYLELVKRNLKTENDEYDSSLKIDNDNIPVSSIDENSSNYIEFNFDFNEQYFNNFVSISDEDLSINKILDGFIRNDYEKFSKGSNVFDKLPKLKKLIQFLQKDPYEENRELATRILNGTNKTSYLAECHEYGIQLHRMAHSLLFSRGVDERNSIHQRYRDNFFEDNEVELFEIVETNSGPIYTIAFDFRHKTFCTGSEKGEVVWGDNHWKLSENSVIESICPLRDFAWAAISSDGIVYILKDGQELPVEAFRPSMREICKFRPQPLKRTHSKALNLSNGQQFTNSLSEVKPREQPEIINAIVCSSQESPIVFISQGNNEILAWDIEALLLVGRIDVESPPKLMTIIGGKLFVALMNGVVLQIGMKNGSIEKPVKNVVTSEASASASTSAFTSASPSISSFTQAQNSNNNNNNNNSKGNGFYQFRGQSSNHSLNKSNSSNDKENNENENISDNEYDNYNYEEADESETNECLLKNVYSCGDELILYVKKRNDKFKGENLIRIGEHKGLLYSVSDKGPLFFWEDFEFPRQITDELDLTPADFLVHPTFPVALILNNSPMLIHLYEDAPLLLKASDNSVCSCCSFDGERPLCAVGNEDGSVAVWRISKPKKDNNGE